MTFPKLRTVPIAQLDVFADRPFTGNPAGVCILDEPAPDSWMADVAREMGCPNTAFLLHGDGVEPSLRWYTAGGVEVALCGHATIATTEILYRAGRLPVGGEIAFGTQSGIVTAHRHPDGRIDLTFPSDAPEEVPDPPKQIAAALGVDGAWVGRSKLDYIVRLNDAATLRGLSPEMGVLSEVDTRGVIVTSPAAEGANHDYELRFFGPRVGMPEDMVTGTAHCALGPLWRDLTGGTTTFRAWQASPRGGMVDVTVEKGNVRISGRAQPVLDGKIVGPEASDGT